MNRAWIPYLVLAVGLLASATVAAALWRTAEARDQVRFDYYVQATRDNIVGRIETYTALLRGTAGLFAADESVSRRDFREYVAQLQLQDRYPGIQGVGFARRVPPDQLDDVVADIREQGVAGFQVWPEADRSEYFPIVYLEPEDFRNRAAVGFDMASNEVRLAAMRQARASGAPAASGIVSLVQELSDQEPQAGFLIFVPVYAQGELPATNEQRDRQLIGFAYSPFRVENLLRGILGRETYLPLDLRIYDGAGTGPDSEIYRSRRLKQGGAVAPHDRFLRSATIDVAGRPWTLVFSGTPRFESSATTASVPYVLVAGILLSIILSAVSRAQVRAREVAERTAEDLRRSEEALWALNETLEQRVVKRTAEAEHRAAQLRRMTVKLTQAEQRERRRLAQVLHDHLQQLLAAARMQIGLLRRRPLEETVGHGVDQVDDLIQQSIEASRSLTLELSPPVLYDADFPAALGWLSRHMLSKHGLEVEVEADPRANPHSQDTRVFLFQAVRELLLNVVRHGDVQQARVRVEPADGNRLRLLVEDRGRGFDPEMVAMSGEDNDAFGLFSIRERIELLGGDFSIDSTPGQGTQVELLAPLGELEAGDEADDEVPEQLASALASPIDAHPDRTRPQNDRHKIRVLLVDDHRIVRAGLAGLLRSQPDMEVIGEASDGQMAVELARQLHPDVISMDVTMPRMSGIDATRLITAELPNVRVIGLSMHEKTDMARAMRDAGAAAYVPKDGPADVLLAAIRGPHASDSESSLPTQTA